MSVRKGIFSRAARKAKLGMKQAGSYLAGKVLGKHSYPLLGVPSGLTSGVEEGEGKLTFLYPEKQFTMTPPKTIEPTLHWNYREVLKGIPNFPADGILCVKNGIATSRGGNLATNGKLITTFLQPIDGKPPKQHDLLRFSAKDFFPSIYTANKPVVTLAAGWQGAFYHWVYEVLPRLHLVEKGGYATDYLYVETASAFQKQSLELMGIKPDQMIAAEKYRAVKAPELIVPSIALTPTYWGCQFLRERILPHLMPQPSLRLYVSRNDATRRRIINEDQVFGVLQKYGFVKKQLAQLTFKEQAELFHAAEVVVGPHGAGFSHLVFCKPKTPFLEIFSPAYFHPCYWHISDRVGLEYHYLFGEGPRYPDGFCTHQDPDIEVDVHKLEAALKLMGL